MKAFYWFEVSTMAGDFSTSREADGEYYHPVKHNVIKTYADLESYLHSLFAGDIVAELMDNGFYRDFDGALYAVCADRGTHFILWAQSGT